MWTFYLVSLKRVKYQQAFSSGYIYNLYGFFHDNVFVQHNGRYQYLKMNIDQFEEAKNKVDNVGAE